MPRWVVVCVLAALALVPSRAMAADCAAAGVPGQYDVFVGGGFTANTGGATIQGRVAARGGARGPGGTNRTHPPPTPPPHPRHPPAPGQPPGHGGGGGGPPPATTPPLTPDANRVDLVAGRNLTVDGGGGSIPYGRGTYGGALTATGALNALGGLHQAQPPFDFVAELATVRERSAQWADLPPDGTIGGPGSYDIRFTGTNATRNVFAVTAAALQGYGQITIDVPPGSTTL